jgi:alkylated DNA repair protein alkB homolog 6
MPHEDGPMYYPSVTMLSIGSSCTLEFTGKCSAKQKIELLVPERSLVEFSTDLYFNYLHSVPFRHTDCLKNVVFGAREDYHSTRFDRYSFTLRHILSDQAFSAGPRLTEISQLN